MRTAGIDGAVPGNDFSVFRLNQELPNRSAIGMMFMERRGDGSINGNSAADFKHTYAMDGRWGGW